MPLAIAASLEADLSPCAGLNNLAVAHYRTILNRVNVPIESLPPGNLVKEAAYNLSLILANIGAPHAAREVVRKFLSV